MMYWVKGVKLLINRCLRVRKGWVESMVMERIEFFVVKRDVKWEVFDILMEIVYVVEVLIW